MKPIFSVLLALSFLAIGGCSGIKHRQTVCSGLMKIGTTAQAYQDIWGLPTKTKITTGAEIMQANVGRNGGSFFKGRAAYQVWWYEEKDVTLYFSKRLRLVDWNTNKTTRELATDC